MKSTDPVASTASTGSPDPRNPRQSTEALHTPDALLKLPTVVEVVGYGRSAIYQKVASGEFPQPVRLGTRCTRWRAGDITAWLKSKGGAA